MNEQKTLEERKALLAQRVAAAVGLGARIESQSETMAVLVTGRRVNHILHFLIGFPTLGFWWLVWAYLAITGGEKRQVVTVDDYGNVLEQKQGGSGGSKLPVIGVGVLGLLLLVGIIAVGSSGTEEEPTDQVSIPTQVASPPTPTLTPTPASTLTPGPSPTPSPTFTPRPTSIPTPTLAETDRAALWVHLSQDRNGYLTVRANTAFDIDTFDLTLFIDGSEYCNTNRMYADEGLYEMGCEYEARSHSSVTRVSAQTSTGDLRCARNVSSSAAVSVFACAQR